MAQKCAKLYRTWELEPRHQMQFSVLFGKQFIQIDHFFQYWINLSRFIFVPHLFIFFISYHEWLWCKTNEHSIAVFFQFNLFYLTIIIIFSTVVWVYIFNSVLISVWIRLREAMTNSWVKFFLDGPRHKDVLVACFLGILTSLDNLMTKASF